MSTTPVPSVERAPMQLILDAEHYDYRLKIDADATEDDYSHALGLAADLGYVMVEDEWGTYGADGMVTFLLRPTTEDE